MGGWGWGGGVKIEKVARKWIRPLTKVPRVYVYACKKATHNDHVVHVETEWTIETLGSFILPLFDYADIVWDNCTDTQSKKLESLHLEAIRMIIGGIRGTSHQKLYIESGFCTLKERRKRHKLLMFHKMILGLCPQYISDLLPPLVAHINPYHRRRPLERDVTTCKTELYRNSFITSTTAEWNSLPISVQQSTSLSVFKRSLSLSDSKVPAYYYFGERNAQVSPSPRNE